MDQKTIFLVVALFTLLIAGMFTFAYLNKTETDISVPEPVTQVEEESLYPGITRIDAKHFYSDRVHTFVGQIELPTPCDLLQSSARVQESMPEQVVLEFSVINTSENCIQVVSLQRFQVTATASEAAVVSATFMGRPVTLNLIPAGPDETPADFELFIKG